MVDADSKAGVLWVFAMLHCLASQPEVIQCDAPERFVGAQNASARFDLDSRLETQPRMVGRKREPISQFANLLF